jgi:hypothetical protein
MSPSSKKPEIMHSSFFLVVQQTCKAKLFFLGYKDTETFKFQELWDLFYLFFSIYIMNMFVVLYLFFLWLFILIARADSKLLL